MRGRLFHHIIPEVGLSWS